jgi:hypothetical protein
MARVYPEFSFNLEDGIATWTGKIGINDETETVSFPKGLPYNPLEIEISCKRDYPLSFPSVTDVKGILKAGGCEHIMGNNIICYAFRPSSELNFLDKNHVVDVIPIIQSFLLKWYSKERTGLWPGGEHLHNQDAIIMWELEHGKIPLDALCPCALTGKSYKEHHLEQVQKRLAQIRTYRSIWVSRIEVGPNSACPCNSGMKFKKCGMKGLCISERNQYSLNTNEIDKEELTKVMRTNQA